MSRNGPAHAVANCLFRAIANRLFRQRKKQSKKLYARKHSKAVAEFDWAKLKRDYPEYEDDGKGY